MKFEAGTPDIAGVVGLGAALDYVTGLGLDAIAIPLLVAACSWWLLALVWLTRPQLCAGQSPVCTVVKLAAGILVAVTDFERFDGNLQLDVADENEICTGMGGRNFITEKGEIVLRDDKEIVCVLCQGAYEKTRVRENNENVLFYAYAVPGIERTHLQEGLAIAADTLVAFGGGKTEFIDVY